MSIVLDTSSQKVTLNLTGPSDVWFGVGFGATSMKDNPWTVVISGNGTVSEHILADHAPGTLLSKTSVK